MGRTPTTCVLASFLAANARKPEEQATAVLASALETSQSLRQTLLEELGVGDDGEIELETEQRTGRGTEKVDLELRVVGEGERRELRRRAWVEVKVNSRLAGALSAADGREARDPQLVRYRQALDAADAAHGGLDASPLGALLAGPPTDHEREQIEQADAELLYWQWIGDRAADRARELGGEDWRAAARQPDASLELANLHSLVWFLEEAQARIIDGTRKPFVGINVTDPLTDEIVADYGGAYRALRMIWALGDRIVLSLEAQGWSTKQPNDGPSDDDVVNTLSYAVLGTLPTGSGWWQETGGQLELDLVPIDDRKKVQGPVVWAGVAFYESDSAPRTTPAWVAKAEREGLVVYDDRETAKLEWMGAVRSFAELVGNDEKTDGQADAVTRWVGTTLDAIALFGPP